MPPKCWWIVSRSGARWCRRPAAASAFRLEFRVYTVRYAGRARTACRRNSERGRGKCQRAARGSRAAAGAPHPAALPPTTPGGTASRFATWKSSQFLRTRRLVWARKPWFTPVARGLFAAEKILRGVWGESACLDPVFSHTPRLSVASVAQLVEQLTLNQLVLGSSPSRGTTTKITNEIKGFCGVSASKKSRVFPAKNISRSGCCPV